MNMGLKREEPHITGSRGEHLDKRRFRRETMEKIRSLKAKSYRGAWIFSAFLLVSIGALHDFSFLPAIPEHVKTVLGAAPSTLMISGLLVLYSFSAIIFALSRMMSGTRPSVGIGHILYLAGFYGFYHLAGSLEENFWAVFTAGVTILGLVSYHNWVRCRALIREERELLRVLDDERDEPGRR